MRPHPEPQQDVLQASGNLPCDGWWQIKLAIEKSQSVSRPSAGGVIPEGERQGRHIAGKWPKTFGARHQSGQ